MGTYYGTPQGDYIDPLDTSNDYIFADAGDDTVYGWDGNDTLDGWTGNDVLYGEAGNDSLLGGSGVDDLYGGGGDDTLDGGTNYEPGGLIGGDGVAQSRDDFNICVKNFLLFINSFSLGKFDYHPATMQRRGDNMYGGPGDDTYYVDNAEEFYFDEVIEYANEGTDTVMSSAYYYGLDDNVENVTLIGDAYGANGNDLDNVMTGNNYDNHLWGDTGHDSLTGQAGDDTLSGGSGDDTLSGGSGDDILTGSDPTDPNVWGSGAGEIDTFYGGDGADTFVLGDSYGVYYQGQEGYALIEDFNGFDGDEIILHGSSEDYSTLTTLIGGPNSVSIFFGEEFGDLIVGIQETTMNGFSWDRDVIFV